MIPTKPSDTTRRRWTANILRVYNQATADQRARGMSWYRTAHQLADMMSEGNPVMAAGVIAALSANKAWDINVHIAREACETGTPRGHVSDALQKAAKILAGADPATVLPMASKTGNFYRCIADPNDAEAVCIDRHAHDIAVGRPFGNQNRGLSNPNRYAALSLVYRNAAAKLDILPSQLQAITWVVWTERNAGVRHRPAVTRYNPTHPLRKITHPSEFQGE